MSYTALRNKLAQALDSVTRDHAPIVITGQNGAQETVLGDRQART
ncbi:MAG: type II toxin-antitoxin system prevent-host-death family antitoxin, partial [Burkholderiales bacterium]